MRPDIYPWAMEIAHVVAKRRTCPRLAVGCVLLDHKGRVLATGYNGVPSGAAHCSTTHSCGGAGVQAGNGTGTCRAVHAETNALIQCKEPNSIHAVVCTCFPCLDCAKMLLNTGMRHLFYDVAVGNIAPAWHLMESLQVNIARIGD